MNTEPTKTTQTLAESMIQRAYVMYMEKAARTAALKAPHKDKVKKSRRAANKVARKSRKGNR